MGPPPGYKKKLRGLTGAPVMRTTGGGGKLF
jgi:hypothetical protein